MKVAYLHLKSLHREPDGWSVFRREMQERNWDLFQSPHWFVSAFSPEQSDEAILQFAEDDLRGSLLQSGGCPLTEGDATCLILDAAKEEDSLPLQV